MRRRRHTLLLALLLSALPVVAGAQEKAQLPYSVVSSYLELFKSLEHLDLITPSMIINPTNPEISPQSIEFKIKDADDWQSFNPDEYGVIEFPDRPDWDSLVLLTNQPKGTLQLVIAYSAKPLKSLQPSYQELMGLVPQFEESLTALATMQGQPPPKIKGLTIQMPEGSGASVHVLSSKGEQTFEPHPNGIVLVRYDDAAWRENPPVEFDEMPLGIVPLQ